MPIMVMGLATRQHILQHYTGQKRAIGAALASLAASLAAIVFVGQVVGKWQEGGWMALISFTILAIIAHLMLLSPAGFREARQVNRIVHDKARVQGGMASIVKWQAYKMQEYRFRLMLGITSFLELFGVSQLSRRRLAPALATNRAMALSQTVQRNIQPMSLRTSLQNFAGSKATSKAAVPTLAAQHDTVELPDRNQLYMPPHIVRHRILLPITGINQGTLTGLRYAQSLSSDVTAVHVSMDRAETERLEKAWSTWGEGVRLVVLESPHNMVLEPLLNYIQSIMALRQANETITVVVPQSIHPRWWNNLTRTQMAVLLRLSLPFETGIVITDVPYVLENEADKQPRSAKV
jgi:hypothetical protein